MRGFVSALGLMLWLAGCAGSGSLFAPTSPGGDGATPVELVATPFFPQQDYQCGPAALATVLVASGVDTTPEDLLDKVYLPARQGSLQAEMIAASRRYERLPYVLTPDLAAVLNELQQGRPVLVLQNVGLSIRPVWHYAVVIGYQPARDEVILRSGVTRRQVISARKFLSTWRKGDYWAMVTLRPGELPAHADAQRYLQAVADLETLQQWEAAHAGYAAAVREWHDNTTAWLGLGNAEYGLGRRLAAESSFRQALRLDPRHPVAGNNLAQLLAERGCHHTAMTIITRAIESVSDASPLRAKLHETRAEILKTRRVKSRQDSLECP